MYNRFMLGFTSVVMVCLLYPQAAQTVQDDQTIKEAVKPAIEAGVEFLRQTQTNLGTWVYQGQNSPNHEQVVGATALCGIALMECGVPVTDKQVKAAYNVVKAAANDPKFNYTYSLCLTLIFLDRINKDKPLKHGDANTILRLAGMIVNGQSADGRWGYHLPDGAVDNSNTQFAVVALWISRKYAGKQVGQIDKALALTERKFRSAQTQEGGWSYDPSNVQIGAKATGSMTCAGILGLALSAGAKGEQRQATFRGAGAGGGEAGDVYRTLEKDPAVAAARTYIVSVLNQFVSGNPQEGHITYFLWSLERAATLYRWRKMDGVDWFEIGARYLMSKQQRNGSWNLDFLSGNVIDTSFALLFLAKSNLLGSLQQVDFTGKEGVASNVIKEKKTEPKKENPKEVAKEMLEKLLTALPDKQAAILDEMSESRNSEFNEILVEAIEKLSTNAGKDAAREALANRFRRLSTKSITENLTHPDREVRLASASAAKLKNDPAAAAGLIPLLADLDIGVSTAALEALKSISGQDFGKSVDRWSRWLDTVNRKKP